MKVIFLGTNGWYDTDTGNTVCTLIESEKYHILLDAGNGIYRAERYIKDSKPIYLFISHFHLDHISGFHILNKFRFRQGLGIYGQKGITQILNTIVARPFTVPLAELPFPVKIQELSEGPYKIPFQMECRYLLHASRCLGYRFELDRKTIAYCADTGPCENAVKLADGADLLIAECSLSPGEKSPEWPHLNPQDAADIAIKAGAKKLALVHFDAERYRSRQDRQAAKDSIKGFEDVIAANDGMELDL